MSVESKIAVVGAGVAGLTAAHELIRNGYKRVSVIESNEQVGGKVYSSKSIKNTAIDMGAIWMIPGNYRIMMDAAKKHKVRLTSFSPKISIHQAQKPTVEYSEYIRRNFTPADIFVGGAKFLQIGEENRKLIQHGLEYADPRLFVSMQDYARSKNIEEFLELIGIFTVGGGYSYLNEAPAAYLMRGYETLINMIWRDVVNSITGLDLSARYMVSGGFQSLLGKMAKSLPDLRLNSRVVGLSPAKNERIKLEIQQSTGMMNEEFDSVFLSTTLPVTRELLKHYPERLEALPSHASHIRYGVTAFIADGLEPGRTHFLLQNNHSSRIGWVNTVLGPQRSKKYFVAYQILGVNQGDIDDESRKKFIEDLHSLGARKIQILEEKVWKYFYHIPIAELRAQPRIFKMMQQTQGDSGIYLIGAGSAGEMEISENVAEQALATVEKFIQINE